MIDHRLSQRSETEARQLITRISIDRLVTFVSSFDVLVFGTEEEANSTIDDLLWLKRIDRDWNECCTVGH